MTPSLRPAAMERRLRRGAYLLPSLFTTGNLLLGFVAIVRGLDGHFATAAVLIFIAGILDAFDGRLARITKTESDFGREYDSLADCFTFGAAPALLAYGWGLSGFGRVGWLIPLFYLVCGAVRLARFNVQTKVIDSRYFVGLPIPAAAGSICSILFLADRFRELRASNLVLALALITVGVLMVSTFRYVSFKKIDLSQRKSYRMLLPLAAILFVIAYDPPLVFLTIAVLYTSSGPLGWLLGRLRHRPADGSPAEGRGE